MSMFPASQDITINFPYPTLTKIHGRPTYLGLRKIENEITANASSVHSDLGGGMHGHLGLVKSDADYAKVAPGTAYHFPTQPDPLTSGVDSIAVHQTSSVGSSGVSAVELTFRLEAANFFFFS